MKIFGSEKKSYAKLFVQSFSVQNILAEGIFVTLYTTRGDKQLKKIVLAFWSFWFWQRGYRENFCQVYHQKIFDHSRGHYENTCFGKVLGFLRKWVASQKFFSTGLKMCSRKKAISKAFGACVFEKFWHVQRGYPFFRNCFDSQCQKNNRG